MTRVAVTAIAAGSLLLAVLTTSAALAGGAPDEKICRDEEALQAADDVTQGGCLATNRRKGNCHACHLIAGIPSGDIAPPLVSVGKRFPDKNQLRSQIEDARRTHPNTIMPPFGTHRILTPDEIDKVLEFLLTL